MQEAHIEKTPEGQVPVDGGWFILNLGEMAWGKLPGFGVWCDFDGPEHDSSTPGHVVDSGSTDGTPEAIARRWPSMALTRMANVGFAAAGNVALRTARGRYVLLLNPDVEIVSGTFAGLVRALDARREIGLASVVQRAPGAALIPSICRDPSPARQLGEALGRVASGSCADCRSPSSMPERTRLSSLRIGCSARC